jgi:hypothetical protein
MTLLEVGLLALIALLVVAGVRLQSDLETARAERDDALRQLRALVASYKRVDKPPRRA